MFHFAPVPGGLWSYGAPWVTTLRLVQTWSVCSIVGVFVELWWSGIVCSVGTSQPELSFWPADAPYLPRHLIRTDSCSKHHSDQTNS